MAAISYSSPSIPLAERAALSVREASAYSGIGRTTIYKMLAEGKLASRKIGSRRLVLRQSIDRFLASLNA